MLSMKPGEPERSSLPGVQSQPRYVIPRARRLDRGVCEVIDTESHGCGEEMDSNATTVVYEGYSPLGTQEVVVWVKVNQ